MFSKKNNSVRTAELCSKLYNDVEDEVKKNKFKEIAKLSEAKAPQVHKMITGVSSHLVRLRFATSLLRISLICTSEIHITPIGSDLIHKACC
jgi:hypothetical protein